MYKTVSILLALLGSDKGMICCEPELLVQLTMSSYEVMGQFVLEAF